MRTRARPIGFGVMALLLAVALGSAAAARPAIGPGPDAFGAAPLPVATLSGRKRPLIVRGTGAPSRFRVNARGHFLVLRSPNGIGALGRRCIVVSSTIQRCRTGQISVLVLKGFGGRDRFKATARVRTPLAMLGGAGADLLVGGSGDDGLDGGGGRDRVLGESGGDRVRGASGNDVLGGGPGDDTVNGGAGRDDCIGGPGADLIRLCP